MIVWGRKSPVVPHPIWRQPYHEEVGQSSTFTAEDLLSIITAKQPQIWPVSNAKVLKHLHAISGKAMTGHVR